ncbi:hypothetical protein ACSFBF_06985 [Variovorax sp. ZT5P49]|uniref:hypothetical protein n=1 Tax=Variovorax sp. ZT5P49 TaxID=3443733 RepID=UPI003F47A941
MKIISRGKLPDLQPIQAECGYCHTVVEFTRQEARHVSDQRDGDYYSLACPVCSKEITKAVRS